MWPTTNGINEIEARRICEAPIIQSPAFAVCSSFRGEFGRHHRELHARLAGTTFSVCLSGLQFELNPAHGATRYDTKTSANMLAGCQLNLPHGNMKEERSNDKERKTETG